MKKYTYNFEIKDLLTQFVAAFDDAVIKRYNGNRCPRQDVEVRYVFAPKQRVMYDIVNKAQNITLPVVTIDLKSVSYDKNRAFNKVNKLYNYKSETESTSLNMPTPINLEVSMSILGKYMQDVEQIITNFAPYTNPYIIIAWKEPSSQLENVEIRTEVLWNETITLNTPTETTYSDKFRIVADTSFTIKGWLFRDQNEVDKPIFFIDQNLIPVGTYWTLDQPLSTLDYEEFFNELVDSGYETNSYRLSGIPAINNIYINTGGTPIEVPFTSPITLNKASKDYNNYRYILLGENFQYTTDIMLSSDNGTLTNNFTSFDTEYTGPVSGYLLPLSSYVIMSDNTIHVEIPYISESGKIDIIVNNPAGWTSTATISGFYMIAE